MMIRLTTVIALLLLNIALIQRAPAQAAVELVPNPLFDAWKGQKLGTAVVHQGNSKTLGLDVTIETVTTLQSIASDQLTLQVERTITTSDEKLKKSTFTQSVPATQPTAAVQKIAEGVEVFVNGSSYRCTVYDSSSTTGELKESNRRFFAAEVPGGIVKIEARTEGPVAMNTVIDLKEVRIPK